MKKLILTFFYIAFFCTISIAQNKLAAPKIISTIPAFGDCKVDPQLKEIEIKFDQDMEAGMSVLDTKNMPQFTDKPHWKDVRTFSIPVKLFPNKLYSLAFNNPKFQGFRSTQQVSLNPDELHFITKPVSSADLNKKAYNELITIFPKQYSYASLKNINWKTLLEKSRPELENSETNTEFALKLVKLFRNADDTHLWVDVEGQRFETGKIKIVENNSNWAKLFSLLHDQKISNGFMTVTGVVDSIGYISIRDWSTDFFNQSLKSFGNSSNQLIQSVDALKELLKYPNLIIDVRENKGGNENFAKKFASLFIGDSVAYEKVLNYNANSGKFDKEHIKWLTHGDNNMKYQGNIYVLSGPSVMSSNESFILMMKQIPNAKVIGMKTYGSSGNPLPVELSNGITIYLPSWQAYTLDGKLIEGNGVESDIEIITSKEDFQNKDGLFDKVVSKIKLRE